MTAKRPRDPNQLGKLIMDIADPTTERSAERDRNHYRKRGMFFRPPRVSPDMGVPGLSD